MRPYKNDSILYASLKITVLCFREGFCPGISVHQRPETLPETISDAFFRPGRRSLNDLQTICFPKNIQERERQWTPLFICWNDG